MSSAKQATAGTNEAAVTPRSLWRNLAFQTLWVGTSASTLGVSVADIAYPLAILAITRSPALAGLFAAVQSLGMLAALSGASTGRLFRRGVPPANVPAGTDLSFLLETTPRFDAGS